MIQHLQVEYKFLDVPPEELETPFALPKPKAGGESIVFNFTKVVAINSSRSRLLVKAMAETEEVPATTSASKESLTSVLPDHVIGFILVSEPEDADLDCEEVVGPDFLLTCNNFSTTCLQVGIAKVDLKELLREEEDMIDKPVNVYSTEAQSKVSKFLNTGNKPIGTLTLTVKVTNVFTTLKILERQKSSATSQSEQ